MQVVHPHKHVKRIPSIRMEGSANPKGNVVVREKGLICIDIVTAVDVIEVGEGQEDKGYNIVRM